MNRCILSGMSDSPMTTLYHDVTTVPFTDSPFPFEDLLNQYIIKSIKLNRSMNMVN